MAAIASFIFNDFQENTYIVYDDTRECVIIDPGCYRRDEMLELTDFLVQHDLKPVRLLQTHCHIDHILGTGYVSEKYKLQPEMHEKELPVLRSGSVMADMYGYILPKIDIPASFLRVGDILKFGNTQLEILFTPGHSPGSISFYSKEDKFVVAGDVLFRQSIGRTDLPGGNFETLIKSIREKLFTLGDDVVVYSGHGPSSTIGFEKENNPFLNDQYSDI